ncbi:MAG: TIGR00730 family Rossman fold protein [Rhodobacteraceae bacterium]|nr:MAG: TIGR00730 family Rossman fold protein [Paracoccaceae bacterium]
MITKPMESVCVYCGSRHGDDIAFTHEARALGKGLAAMGVRLVYGAGDVGLMGEVARAALSAGGKAVGVIPRHILELEVGLRDLTALILTDTMHERKKIMFANADAVVALPGGAGTLDELVEVLTWRQLGLHAKPLILMNAGGYWDPFLALIDHVIAKGFAAESLRHFITVAADAAETLALLAEHR